MSGVVPYLGQSFNHRSDAGQRPQIGSEAVGAGTLQQCSLYLAQLPTVQPRLTARSARTPQGRGTAPFPFRIPATHTLPADFELMSDSGQHRFACREQTGGLFASTLQCLEIAARANVHRHASIVEQAGLNVTILCEVFRQLCHCIMRVSVIGLAARLFRVSRVI